VIIICDAAPFALMAMACGDGLWRWLVAMACGDGLWRWLVAMACGDGLRGAKVVRSTTCDERL